ncbi:MAG: GNAT family N-acetyltransferase [Dehalococcoidales bacterium]|nr:GNAT family N-acetyltransferase [Dehalococcoidales bacterium]
MNSVKPATSADIEELVNLMAEFYRESGYRLNSELSRQALSKLVENPKLGQVWLLQCNNQVAGYVVLTLVFSMEYGGLAAFVDDLFVRSKFRRLGLGRCGLDALLAECRRRGVRAVHIEVGRNNKPAKKLYAKFGFRDNDRQLLTLRLEEETSVL